jgi:endogenous inhibitor of DNA gyrase (YacG/DUF329 family)
MLEFIRRCPYCKRESNRDPREWAENPYCSRCLSERLSIAKKERGAIRIVQQGHYWSIVPVSRTHP